MSNDSERVAKEYAITLDKTASAFDDCSLARGTVGGFTWEDVDDLREVADIAHRYAAENSTVYDMGSKVRTYAVAAQAGRVDGIADRIAALLPPREGE